MIGTEHKFNVNEPPTTALARIISPLDASRAATLRESFGAMFDRVVEWQAEASDLTVTSEEQTGKMKRARLLRLEIREARVALDKKRKELKAGILTEGRAIDGAFAVFEGLASPLESHLKEQETFAERAEEARCDALQNARAAALVALDVPPLQLSTTLGKMSEAEWFMALEDARRAKMAREEIARAEEAARIEEARIQAEQEAVRRAEELKRESERQAVRVKLQKENDRLRAEAAKREAETAAAQKREAKAKKANEAFELALRAEREAREHAEAETARLEEEKSRRSQKLEVKYAILLEGLRVIASPGYLKGAEPRATKLAQAILKQAGER